jgi:threonine dehydrogenase-like Zn-dependent dehydrogenase
VTALGFEPDAIIECTGVRQLIAESIQTVGASGIVCLTGVGHGGIVTSVDDADIAAAVVLKNNVIVGSVNANKRHWYRAGQFLARADRSWLARLISRRVPPKDFMSALERKPDDIKVVIQFSDA